MDWLMIVTIAAVITAMATLWRMYRLKKEVYDFAEQIESALDQIISGEGVGDIKEETQDTLWGKCGEKLYRVNSVWQKKEEESLREKQQIKELISDISHQTKTPIANVKLYVEFLQEEKLSFKGKEFLENLNTQIEKLDFLLKSMMKMSRLEAGIIQIRSERANLYETMGRAVAEIVPAASKKNIELFAECEEKIYLQYDKKWTEEALFNVLDNAVKYTNPGGKICIKVTRQEIFTKISISDTGKGIALERQAEVFTRFYREPEVHDKPGIGIGLYLTRKMLEMQGGYIEVRSKSGEGAQFCIYLPNS